MRTTNHIYLSGDRLETIDMIGIAWFQVQYTSTITLTPYIVLPLFATRFADYAGGIRVPFIQPHVF